MKKIKHKLVIVTSSALMNICDAIIENNMAAGRAIGKVVKTASHKLIKKRYIKISRPS